MTALITPPSGLPAPATGLSSLTATILGTGACLPARVVPNRYFVEDLKLETSEEWIESKTGIRERRIADAGTGVHDLAIEAGLRAIENAGLLPTDLSLIIVATSTSDYVMPSVACLVQSALMAGDAAAFDLHAACAGYAYAFDTAVRMLQSLGGNALVIGADVASRLTNPRDRGTCIFFGDGAGAVVLGASGGGRVLASEVHSRGTVEPLCVPAGGFMTMDGRAVWDFATDRLPRMVRSLCRQSGVDLDEVALLVPHQANRKILEHAAHQLDFPMERVMCNIDRYGNTVGGSIPIALDEALKSGRAGRGDYVVIAGFGAGLAWGGSLIQL